MRTLLPFQWEESSVKWASFTHTVIIVHLNLILFQYSLINSSVFIKRNDERTSEYETYRRKVKTMISLYGNIIVKSIQFYRRNYISRVYNFVFCVSVNQSVQMLTMKLNSVRHRNVSNAEFVVIFFFSTSSKRQSETMFGVFAVWHVIITWFFFYGFTWHINVKSRIRNAIS